MKIYSDVSVVSPKVSFKSAAPLRRYVSAETIRRNESYATEVGKRFCGLAGESYATAQTLTYGMNTTRLSFLDKLVKKYNQRNFGKEYAKKEDASPITRIAETVTNPSAEHFGIAMRNQGSFETLERIFDLAKSKEELAYVQNLQHGALRGKKDSSATIVSLLESKNAQKYETDAETYESYLQLNAGKKDAVKKLDKMVNEGTFSKKKYDNGLAVKNIMKNKAISSVMSGSEEFLASSYSKEGETFLRAMFKDFFVHKKEPSKQNVEDILDMYKTTTAENLDQRLEIIKNFKFSHLWEGKRYNAQQEISSMRDLFSITDKNKNAAKFVEKALDKDIKTGTITDLKEIVETVDLPKATIFINNVKRIIGGTKGEARKTALQTQIDNPDFKPAGFEQGESFIGKIFRKIENKINVLRYNFYQSRHAS